jgi:hypothetical protein
VDDTEVLTHVRDIIVDWLLFEGEANPTEKFATSVIEFLEQLRALKLRPPELQQWNEVWFEAHKLFAYETFLYVVAALIKVRCFTILHEIFHARYLRTSEEYGQNAFARFDDFYAYSEILNSVLAQPSQRLYSPAAELISRHALRSDMPLLDIVQADLLVMLYAFIDTETRWYPQMLYYGERYSRFPFFVRASVHKHFLELGAIVGITDAQQLRDALKLGFDRLNVKGWNNFMFSAPLEEILNAPNWDTIK